MGVMMCEISSLVRPVAEIFLANRAAGAFSSPFFFLLVVSRLFLSTASMVLGAFTSCCRAAVSWGSRKTDSPPTSIPSFDFAKFVPKAQYMDLVTTLSLFIFAPTSLDDTGRPLW